MLERTRSNLAGQVAVALIVSLNITEADPINKSLAEFMVCLFQLALTYKFMHERQKMQRDQHHRR